MVQALIENHRANLREIKVKIGGRVLYTVILAAVSASGHSGR